MSGTEPLGLKAPKPDLSNVWDEGKLRGWMKNARRLQRDDVYEEAFRQLCRCKGRDLDDELDREFAAVMHALEHAMSEEAGATRRLSRTRQKLARAGVIQTLADLALKPQPSLGFLKLLEFGMGDMSAEALVLKHRERFSADVVEAAQQRLEKYGLEAPG